MINACLDSEDQLKKYKENKKTNNASFGDEKELDLIIKKFQQEKEELQKVIKLKFFFFSKIDCLFVDNNQNYYYNNVQLIKSW